MSTQFLDFTKYHLGMCLEPGCNNVGTPCRLPRYLDLETDELVDDEVDYYYCYDHAHENGFCWCCGDFWGGIESFEFVNRAGLCDNCETEIDYDDDYEDEYENDYHYSDLEWPYP